MWCCCFVDRSSMSRIVRRVRALDIYSKADESVQIKTNSGGLLSLITFAIVALLLVYETADFLTTKQTHTISVDTTGSGATHVGLPSAAAFSSSNTEAPAELYNTNRAKLQINIDITFHALRCSETNLDVLDVSGDASLAS